MRRADRPHGLLVGCFLPRKEVQNRSPQLHVERDLEQSSIPLDILLVNKDRDWVVLWHLRYRPLLEAPPGFAPVRLDLLPSIAVLYIRQCGGCEYKPRTTPGL
jgi:hypothetical protein